MNPLTVCSDCAKGDQPEDYRHPTASADRVSWWWMSFASNETGENLGICIVNGDTLSEAIARTHRKGINPGGEVQAMPIPPIAEPFIAINDRLRLMPREEAKDFAESFDAIMYAQVGG